VDFLVTLVGFFSAAVKFGYYPHDKTYKKYEKTDGDDEPPGLEIDQKNSE
jgi:hypothetical protein